MDSTTPTTSTVVAPQEQRAVTMQDIANLCGVSLITVSRALRQDPRVKESTARQVLDIAAQLGYDAAFQQAARRLALKRHGLTVTHNAVALFMHGNSLQASYFTMLVSGLMSSLTSQGFALLIADMLSEERRHQPIPPILRGEVDGYIFPGWTYSNLEPLLNTLRKPYGPSQPRHLLALLATAPGCSAVVADDFNGGYQATDHLLNLGHRRIMHFYQGESAIESERFAGCRQAVIDRGLSPESCLVPTQSDRSIKLPQRHLVALRDILTAHPEVTAVLMPNDDYAKLAMPVLTDMGKRVPDDISIIGFDDTDGIMDEHGHNILTTVHVPLEDIGRHAAELLVKQIRGEAAQETVVTLPTNLVIRGTTGPARS
ncbi:MAG: LacI family DNA-binding transcriptional regulator [Armatimonadota bacterium]